jgi:hypothetical protein
MRATDHRPAVNTLLQAALNRTEYLAADLAYACDADLIVNCVSERAGRCLSDVNSALPFIAIIELEMLLQVGGPSRPKLVPEYLLRRPPQAAAFFAELVDYFIQSSSFCHELSPFTGHRERSGQESCRMCN